MFFHAYIAANGNLIVQKDGGPAARQAVRTNMRLDLGVIEAPDLEQARNLARTLRGTEVKSMAAIRPRPERKFV